MNDTVRHELADELGHIRAQIAELKQQESEIRDDLLKLDAQRIEGKLFRVVIVQSVRKVTDWKSIAKKLNASAQMIAGNTKVGESISLRVNCRS